MTTRPSQAAPAMQYGGGIFWLKVCAWCESALPEDERAQGEHVSHGICDDHYAELVARIRARKVSA